MTTEVNIAIAIETQAQTKQASLTVEGNPWARLYHENAELVVEFYTRNDGKPWSIPYFYAVSALEDAKRQLHQQAQSAA